MTYRGCIPVKRLVVIVLRLAKMLTFGSPIRKKKNKLLCQRTIRRSVVYVSRVPPKILGWKAQSEFKVPCVPRPGVILQASGELGRESRGFVIAFYHFGVDWSRAGHFKRKRTQKQGKFYAVDIAKITPWSYGQRTTGNLTQANLCNKTSTVISNSSFLYCPESYYDITNIILG